jgi:ABC-type lipoprotein release transport system permease subunit
MRVVLGIAGTAVTAILRHRSRSLVTTACVVAVVLPYVAGLGLSKGIQQEAEDAVRFGADLYVTASQFGRPVPIPVAAADPLRQVDGVTAVVPRIVGGIVLGKENETAVLVGLPPDRFPAGIDCIEGALPAASTVNELVVGSELARRLGLRVGDLIPPFYHSRGGERLSRVVGIFRSDVSLWQTHLLLTTFEAAAAIFDQQGLATDLLVTCQPGYEEQVRQAILRSLRLPSARAGESSTPWVTTRTELGALLPQGLLHREGIFNLLFLLAFVVGILVVLVTSGFGLSGRRREIGILKATGWQTDEILLRGGVESFLLSLAGASLSVVLAFLWLELLNGYWIASVFLAGVSTAPGFKVPYHLTPVPALVAFLISFVVVLSGTLYSSWRAATAAPFEAIRSAR